MTDSRFVAQSTNEISAAEDEHRKIELSPAEPISCNGDGDINEDMVLSSVLADTNGLMTGTKFEPPKDHNGIVIPYATMHTLESDAGAVVSFDEKPEMIQALTQIQIATMNTLIAKDSENEVDSASAHQMQQYVENNPDAMSTDEFIRSLGSRGERLNAAEQEHLREVVDPYRTGFMHFNGVISEILTGRKRRIKVGKVYIE
jgi:hypothetical protein